MTSQYIASAVAVLQEKVKGWSAPLDITILGAMYPLSIKLEAIKKELQNAQIFLDALGFVPNLEQTEQARGKSFEGLLEEVFLHDTIMEIYLNGIKEGFGAVLQGYDLAGFYQSMRKVQYYYNQYKSHAKTD